MNEKHYSIALIAAGTLLIGLGVHSCVSNPKSAAFLGSTESGMALLPIMFYDKDAPYGHRTVTFEQDRERWAEVFCRWNKGGVQHHSLWNDLEMDETVSKELEAEALRLMKEEGCY